MDSLKDIHWKLSAKEEELMVKERGFPLGCTVLIWFDVRAGKLSAEGFSKMIERAASLSRHPGSGEMYPHGGMV